MEGRKEDPGCMLELIVGSIKRQMAVSELGEIVRVREGSKVGVEVAAGVCLEPFVTTSLRQVVPRKEIRVLNIVQHRGRCPCRRVRRIHRLCKGHGRTRPNWSLVRNRQPGKLILVGPRWWQRDAGIYWRIDQVVVHIVGLDDVLAVVGVARIALAFSPSASASATCRNG